MRFKILTTILFFMLVWFPLSSLTAEGGFGVSGNFSSYDYKMVPGERLFTPDVHVLFYNNFDVDINVELNMTITNKDGTSSVVGDRVRFIIEESLVRIPAGESLQVSVGIELDVDAPPGEYRIGLSAEVLPGENDGISLTGSAEIRTDLTVFGEAGDLSIQTFDMFNEALPATLAIYREDEDGLFPVGTSSDGTFMDRKIPGDYFVVARYKEKEVARQSFRLTDGELTELDLMAQTVFIDAMELSPIFSETTGLLSRIQVDYTMTNIHTMVEDIHLVLDVIYEGTPFFEGETALIPFLPEEKFAGRFFFTPDDGWQAGDYTFQLEAYQGDFTFEESYFIGESRIRNFNVSSEWTVINTDSTANPIVAFLNWGTAGITIAVLAGSSVLVWFFVFYKKAPLDAIQHTKKRFKDKGFDLSSKHVSQCLDNVRIHMHPGTDFEGETRGTDDYYEKVDAFLRHIDAFVTSST